VLKFIERVMEHKPLSLAARAALATGFALAAFLGLTWLAQNKANYASELSAMHDRLHNYAIAFITGTEVTRAGKVTPPDSPPHPDFSRPGSGLYGVISGDDGYRWESSSALGRDMEFARRLPMGSETFEGPLDTHAGRLYVYSFGVDIDPQNGGKPVHLTFTVAQTEDQFERQVSTYRRTQFLWLATLGLMLILLQLLLLRWSLLPLRRVSSDLALIERGDREHLEGPYPVELMGLTARLNAFIDSERDQRTRYQNTLADLAHSLKTPLAVVRSQLEAGLDVARADVLDQVRRMDEIVAYQLSRAATSGRKIFATPVMVSAHAEDLVQSLEKVYAGKNVLCEFEIEEKAAFYGEQGDLLELMGNLLENAFKWANHRVLLTVKSRQGVVRGRPGLSMAVEDDGPGIADAQIERVLQRGVRGDERVKGHGIGLSIVQDIVKAYQGTMHVDRSEEFGGARFTVVLPPG
jgi:two-component system sensor histidine kinase PhoQ